MYMDIIGYVAAVGGQLDPIALACFGLIGLSLYGGVTRNLGVCIGSMCGALVLYVMCQP